jgi:hypothetical protein
MILWYDNVQLEYDISLRIVSGSLQAYYLVSRIYDRCLMSPRETGNYFKDSPVVRCTFT